MPDINKVIQLLTVIDKINVCLVEPLVADKQQAELLVPALQQVQREAAISLTHLWVELAEYNRCVAIRHNEGGLAGSNSAQ